MVSVCFGTVHPDKSSCLGTDDIPDGFHSHKKTAQMSQSPTPLLSLASPCIHQAFFGEVWPLLQTGSSGLSLLTCSPSFVLSLQHPRSGHHQQWLAMSPRAGQTLFRLPGRSSARTSSGLKPHKGAGIGFLPRSLGH